MQINKVLQILLGDRETIRQSTTSGVVSTLFMTIMFAIYSVFFEFDMGIKNLFFQGDFDFWEWYIVACLSLGLIVCGGSSIGWLLIRPIAMILYTTFPKLDSQKVWIISTVSVWVLFTLLTFYPHQQENLLYQGVLLIGLLVWAIVTGIVGGIVGARITPERKRKEWRESRVVGGVVTGISLVVLQALIGLTGLTMLPFVDITRLSGGIISSLAMVSFFAMIPYFFTDPLSDLLSRFNCVDIDFPISHVLVNWIAWSLIGYLLFNWNTPNSLNGIAVVITMGFCGACGGWATAQFKINTSFT